VLRIEKENRQYSTETKSGETTLLKISDKKLISKISGQRQIWNLTLFQYLLFVNFQQHFFYAFSVLSYEETFRYDVPLNITKNKTKIAVRIHLLKHLLIICGTNIVEASICYAPVLSSHRNDQCTDWIRTRSAHRPVQSQVPFLSFHETSFGSG
jgi:hypothetical protein